MIDMMIESLELDNFKSFGNKRKILFRKGFTVISGPNGSGKSNIGDSMLFVLGVRSSKAVRADRLADLIHKASSPNRQRDTCKVTITFNSENPELSEDEKRIRLTRELISDTESYHSNYYINGERVRHSDVERLLDSLHIYLDSYSFVLQGDINNIIKMSGIERRKLLESISGIESFDVQIDKAKSDIEAISGNLTKLEIMHEEAQRRLEELRIDKENAETFNSYSQRIKDMRATLLGYDLNRLNRDVESVETQISSLTSEIDTLNLENSGLQEDVESKRSTLKKLEEEREAISGSELGEIRQHIADLRVKIAEFRMKKDDRGEQIHNLQEEVSSRDSQSEEIRKTISSKSDALESRESELMRIQDEMRRIEEQLSKMRIEFSDSTKSAKKFQERLVEIDASIDNINSQNDAVREKYNELIQEKSKIMTELVSREEKRKDLEFQIKDAQWRLKDISGTDQTKRKTLQDLRKQYYEVKNELEENQKAKEAAKDRLSILSREYDKLTMSMQGSRGAGSRTLSSIINARNQNMIDGIHGPIRDLISFDEKYRSAVESTAGGRLNAVVVENDQVAQECLEYLRKEKIGKLTFLPLNKLSTGRPRGKAIIVHGSDGSLGYVFEHISYESVYEAAVWYAFQDTVIVDTVQTARKYMVGVRLVTLGGDIFEASGAITGGYNEARKSNAATESKLSQLSSEINGLNEELSILNPKIEDGKHLVDQLTTEMTELSKEEGSKTKEIDQLREIAEKAERQIEGVDSQVAESEESLRKTENHLKALNEEMLENGDKIDQLSKEKSEIHEKLKSLSPETVELQSDLERTYASLRTDEQSMLDGISSTRSDLKHMEGDLQENAKLIGNSTNQIVQLKDEVNVLQDRISEQNTELEKYRKIEEEMDQKTKEQTEKIHAIENEVERISGRMEGNKSLVSTKHDVIITLSSRLETYRTKITEIEEQLAETGGTAIQEKLSITEIKGTISDLENRIEQLGPINHKAITEFDEVSVECSNISEEMTRLKEEKKSLEDLTEKLNEQKKTIFLNLYHAINQHMNEIYATLSAGGEAQLVLSDELDPLNAEVSIRARPKGRNFSKLHSLSGGEKSLTALSFIMAVQRINPSPIYYLDEVDMFLDGANVERIGKMFKSNSSTSQILVVSLRKAMLKYAENIIGVTSFDEENTEVFEKSLGTEPEVF